MLYFRKFHPWARVLNGELDRVSGDEIDGKRNLTDEKQEELLEAQRRIEELEMQVKVLQQGKENLSPIQTENDQPIQNDMESVV